jgi:hypothetical protein
MSRLQKVENLLSNWQEKTKAILLRELKKQGIGDTDALYNELAHDMEKKAEGYFNLNLHMLRRGRFIDMGVGRGITIDRVKAQRDKSRGAKRKRRAKKWYSRAFYGRLNDLQGAIGFKMMEEANEIVMDAITLK